MNVNFNEIDNRIEKLGYKYIYDNYYLHLIVFIGEYINATDDKKGKWILKHNHNYPLVFQPSFVDSGNVDYYFTINMEIAKELQARFLGKDYAYDQGIDIEVPFQLKSIATYSFEYRDLKEDKD